MTERKQEIFRDNDVMQKEDKQFVQKLRMRNVGFEKDLLVNPQLRIVGSDSKSMNYLMN